MTDLLLAEELFLLVHDEESGRQQSMATLDSALSAALLLDLAAHGLVVVDDEKVVVTAATTDQPLLAEAQAAIAAETQPRKPDHWLAKLPKALDDLGERIGTSLVGRGILDREDRRTLGLFRSVRWPERDGGPERGLRARLHEVLVGGATPDPPTLLLIVLLQQHQLVDHITGRDDRKAARARSKELADAAEHGDLLTRRVGDAVRAMQAALFVAVFVPVITATTVSTT